MLDSAYALEVFDKHRHHVLQGGISGCTVLELGPGDSLFTAIFSRTQGAERTFLVDAGDFATKDLNLYRAAATAAMRRGVANISPQLWQTITDMLDDCNAEYMTNGLASLRSIPARVIDFSFSQAVLEHVRRVDFAHTMRELHRVTQPGGLSSHQVDLRDHLGGSLNSLRFGEDLWESRLFRDSGFYTNRLRSSEIIESMRSAGFEVTNIVNQFWDDPPIARKNLDPMFSKWSDDELRISSFHVLLRAT